MNTAFNYSGFHTLQNSDGSFNNDEVHNKNIRFEIRTLEWMETQRPSLFSDAEKLRRFEIIWIRKGKGNLWADEQNLEITDNTIYCLSPGTFRKFSITTNLEGHYMSFTPEFIWLSSSETNLSIMNQNNSYPNIISSTISIDMQHELEIIVRKMKWEFGNYLNQRFDILKGLLNVFLIYISRNLKNKPANDLRSQESELVKKFLGSLNKNFITQKKVSEYASQLCVTPNYLNRTIKRITGFTASHHIRQQIILEAKRKAIYSTSTMKEIAYSLGFDNIAHFSKFFKNNCGMSFTEFKANAIKPE